MKLSYTTVILIVAVSVLAGAAFVYFGQEPAIAVGTGAAVAVAAREVVKRKRRKKIEQDKEHIEAIQEEVKRIDDESLDTLHDSADHSVAGKRARERLKALRLKSK